MNTTIRYTVLDGNIGDEWHDVTAAAHALAAFMADAWTSEAGTDSDVRVDVQENTCGANNNVLAYSDDGADVDVTSVNDLWQQFCESEAAAPFATIPEFKVL